MIKYMFWISKSNLIDRLEELETDLGHHWKRDGYHYWSDEIVDVRRLKKIEKRLKNLERKVYKNK